MANNRMYIYDEEQNMAFYLAKAFHGWFSVFTEDDIDDFLSSRDFTSAINGTKTTLRLIVEDELPEDVLFYHFNRNEG